MKDLKELLGDELWAQVEPKLKGQGVNGKDLHLVATNTGEFVPAEKYDALKAEALKNKTDYETLNGKYEVDIQNAAKQSNDLLKKVIVSQALTNAKVAKVNEGYDVYFDSKIFDLEKLNLNGANIDNLDATIKEFTSKNPHLVATATTTPAAVPAQATPVQPVAVPASQGLNPASQQNAVKDATYYKEKISKTEDNMEKIAYMMEAEKAGINI